MKKIKISLVPVFFLVISVLFIRCTQTPAVGKTAVQNRSVPDELKKEAIFNDFVGKKTILSSKVVDLPKSDFALVFIAIPKDNPVGTDPAEINAAKLFVFNNKLKKSDAAKTDKINADLKSSSDEAANCGGLASLDINSFVANQEFVHLDQFFAPGMERTTCVSKIIWDAKSSAIVVQRIETVTE
jgi:hypothetical protein